MMAIRDMGPANVMLPIALHLRSMGHIVHLFLEGEGRGKEKLRLEHEPYRIIGENDNPMSYVAALGPDVVVTGLSSPRKQEGDFDKAARNFAELKIKLVHAIDYWGVEKRASIAPDLSLTIDEVSDALVRKRHSNMGRTAHVGFAGIAPLTPNLALEKKLNDLRRETGAFLLVYPDGGPDADPALRHLEGCIRFSMHKVILIPKFHPKFNDVQNAREGLLWSVWYKEALAPLRKRGLVHDFSESTDELAEYADGVASGYSSVLMRAAVKGKLALTLWNDRTASEFYRQVELKETPLMMHGGYPILDVHKPLDDLLSRKWPMYKLTPLDARKGAEAILSVCK